MNKVWKITQYGYLVVALILLIDVIYNWNSNRKQSYFSIAFAIFMVVLFFFKRKMRRKVEERNKQN